MIAQVFFYHRTYVAIVYATTSSDYICKRFYLITKFPLIDYKLFPHMSAEGLCMVITFAVDTFVA